MIKLPLEGKWTIPNLSDKFGSLFYTKNINLDSAGYVKLSPRAVNLFDDSGDVTNISDTDFAVPVSFGRTIDGTYYLATVDIPVNITVNNSTKTIAEDVSANNPTLTTNSHGCWWQNRFHESTATAVNYNTGGTWTANAITGLTSGVRHYMAVFKNRNTICVSNGNVVKQYDTSYAASVDLTIPSDFEIIGMAYNNYKLGIITRLGSDSSGQNADCYFFIWDGATTSANLGVSLGTNLAQSIVPYKSSFVVLDNTGRLLYWNGGGFDVLATFPFYNENSRWGDLLNLSQYGDSIVVEGDLIYINVNCDLSNYGKFQEVYLENNPSGVWCFDPAVGLYHRYSPSLSKTYLHTITSANINTTTDVFTTASTIPATGNPVTLSSGTPGGLKRGVVYFVIKLTATTFQLAETKSEAEAGVYIDITSATDTSLFLYDIIDYGASFADTFSGGITIWGTASRAFNNVLFGGRYDETDLSSVDVLCSTVPFLESRGYIVTPRIYLDIKDTWQSILIKYKKLEANDKIIVKYKAKDYTDIPISTPNDSSNDELVWTSDNEGYTSSDLSAVKTAFDAGEEMEVEFLSGIGAGQMVKLSDIDESSGVYSLVFAESVVGATTALKSNFIINNWTTAGEVNPDNQSDGIAEIPLGAVSSWIQFKIELRGYNTTIQELQINNQTQRK
jgi:hypothetical protein